MSTAVINLITGINGSGKTLYMLKSIEALAKGDPNNIRPVYYWGIRGLKEAGVLDWIEVAPMDESGMNLEVPEPDTFHELPENSIIVIDEAHAVFPKNIAKPRRAEAEAMGWKNGEPPYIARFATSRWRGHTFFLCTQNGDDLSNFIRSRVGKHHHLVRVWGMERATLWTWERYAKVTTKTEYKQGFKTGFPFPKDVYGWYKSADTHAVKKSPPWKKLSMFIWAPIAVLLIGYWVSQRLYGDHKPEDGQTHHPASETHPAASPAPNNGIPHPDEATAWAAQWVERVPGHPYSAPIYDAAIEVSVFPKISGCMEIVTETLSRCTCNTQQGTIISNMPTKDCQFYLANGWFDFSSSSTNEGNQYARSQPEQPQMAFTSDRP